MDTRTITVGTASGLHARPAATFVKAAAASGHKVRLMLNDKSADAASLLAVLSLGVKLGDAVTLETEGAEAERVGAALAELLASDLDAA